MRGTGLFNLFYGTTGMESASFLGRPEGVILCLYMMVFGAAMFLGFIPRLKTIYAFVKNRLVQKSK